MHRTILIAVVIATMAAAAAVSIVKEARGQTLDEALKNGIAMQGIMVMQEYDLLFGRNPCEQLIKLRPEEGVYEVKDIARYVFAQLLYNQIIGEPVELEILYGNAFDSYQEEVAKSPETGLTYGGCTIHLMQELLRDRTAFNWYRTHLENGTMPDWLHPDGIEEGEESGN